MTEQQAAWTIANTINVIGVGIAFVAVIMALLKDVIVDLLLHPRLSVTIRDRAPDCHKTKFGRQVVEALPNGQLRQREMACDCYYFRLWIQNEGHVRANNVQVFAAKLSKKQANGKYTVVDSFLPMNLKWSHAQHPAVPEIFADGISPHMGKHCDLGHILHPQQRDRGIVETMDLPSEHTTLILDLEVAPFTRSHLVSPGQYRLELRVAAANAKPKTITLALNLTGRWFDEERQMLTEGIGLEIAS